MGSPRDRSDDDATLVRRALERDERAFGELVRRYLRRALAVAWEFCETREDAEDIVQDAFTRVARSLDRFDVERPFAPWLFTIVRNTARDAGAARKRRDAVVTTSSSLSTPADDGAAYGVGRRPANADVPAVLQEAAELVATEWTRASAVATRNPAEIAELREWIGRAVEALPEMQRACFRLCEVEGFTRAEVGVMLGITEPTVRVHLHRARRALQEMLRPLTDDERAPAHPADRAEARVRRERRRAPEAKQERERA